MTLQQPPDAGVAATACHRKVTRGGRCRRTFFAQLNELFTLSGDDIARRLAHHIYKMVL